MGESNEREIEPARLGQDYFRRISNIDSDLSLQKERTSDCAWFDGRDKRITA